MEIFPALKIGWFNGWILICLFYLVYIFLLLTFPGKAVSRLYDKSGRNSRKRIFIFTGSLVSFVYFSLIIFTPLKIGHKVFVPGIALFALGMLGFVIALFNFKNAPVDRPVTTGLYRI